MKRPQTFIMIEDKDSNWFCVDRQMQHAWDMDGKYLGELQCEESKEGYIFTLKQETDKLIKQ